MRDIGGRSSFRRKDGLVGIAGGLCVCVCDVWQLIDYRRSSHVAFTQVLFAQGIFAKIGSGFHETNPALKKKKHAAITVICLAHT